MPKRPNLAAAMRYAGNMLGLRLWSNEEGLVALINHGNLTICYSIPRRRWQAVSSCA